MWTRLAERPEAARLFDEAMQSLTQGVNGPLTTNYPFEKFGWIVDVGGGNGSLLLPVVEHHPAMRLTIFDLPHVADAVRGRIAAAGLSDRCEAVGGDAFVAVPDRAIWQWGFIERLANGLRYKEVGPEENAAEFLAVAEAWAEVETV